MGWSVGLETMVRSIGENLPDLSGIPDVLVVPTHVEATGQPSVVELWRPTMP